MACEGSPSVSQNIGIIFFSLTHAILPFQVKVSRGRNKTMHRWRSHHSGEPPDLSLKRKLFRQASPFFLRFLAGYCSANSMRSPKKSISPRVVPHSGHSYSFSTMSVRIGSIFNPITSNGPSKRPHSRSRQRRLFRAMHSSD